MNRSLVLTFGKTVTPSLVLVVVCGRRTPSLVIKIHAIVYNSVVEEERETASPSLSISTVRAQATASWAFNAHVSSVGDAISLYCPFPTTTMLVHAVHDVVICLTMTPLFILVVVVSGCTPMHVVLTALSRAFGVVFTLVDERKDTGGVVGVSCQCIH